MTEPLSRRSFVATLATGLAATRLASSTNSVPPKLLVGHSGITWGDAPENVEQAVRDVAATGYRSFETSASVLEALEKRGGVKAILQQNSLQLRSAYCPFELTDTTKRAANVANAKMWGKLIKDNGGSIAVIGPNTVDRNTFRIKNERYTIVDELNAIGHALADAGVVGALHPRKGSCVQSKDEVYPVMEGVDTRVVKLAPDTGELLSGGVDPAKVIRDFGSVVRHAHLKDYDAGSVRDGFCPLGQGRVDLNTVITELEAISKDIVLMVELNPTSSGDAPTPLECAQTSKEYLKKLGYTFTK